MQEILTEVATKSAQVRQENGRYRRSVEARDAAIRKAVEQGSTHGHIAAVAGLNRTRVSQICAQVDTNLARRRVTHLVKSGRIPHANLLPCHDCQHRWKVGDPSHEYDHHRGYSRAHRETVEPVCSSCHNKRTLSRHGVYL